jgi:hypothetical protein
MTKEQLVKTLELQLSQVKEERQCAKRDPALLAARTTLKEYQAARLARTHADLLAAPDTHAAAVFFLNELYGAQDLSQRDVDLERIIPTMQRMLTLHALDAITQATVLDALSERLDTAMAKRLGVRFSEDDYVAAYRMATARADRERQLDLVQGLGDALCELVRIPLLSTMLAIMRGPSRLAGLSSLQQFLEHGFSTFKKMREPHQFVATIVRRERAVLDNIYGQREHPFSVDP